MVYFELILVIKTLQMKPLETVRIAALKKIRGGALFLILANKALYGDSFLVISTIFQNSYFKQHLRTTASERFFVLRKQSPENVKKASLKNLRKLSRQRP